MARANDDETLCWKVHLAKRDPRKAWAVVVSVALAAAIGGQMLGIIGAIVGAWLIFASTVDFLIPIHYKISRAGAESRCLWQWQQIAWDKVRRVDVAERAVRLSPFSRPSRLDAYRGVCMRFDGNHDEALAAIERWRSECEPVGRAAERGTKAAAN